MRAKLSLILTLFAWLVATGSHWDLVQTFAWGKMFATYSQSMSYVEAAKLTFSADNLCGVCEIVAEATQDEADRENSPGKSGAREIQLNYAPVPAIVLAGPVAAPWSPTDPTTPSGLRTGPPTPPPRV
ncbi:MAG: hypothetical protein SynsKO_25680 [Synoicihabitans sp.]